MEEVEIKSKPQNSELKGSQRKTNMSLTPSGLGLEPPSGIRVRGGGAVARQLLLG